MTEVTRILVKALKLMDGGKAWNNETLERDQTYCAMGAISKAAEGKVRNVGEGNKPADEAARVLASVIRLPRGERSMTDGNVDEIIPVWNDYKPSSHKGFRSIKAGFCRAIKKSMEVKTSKKRTKRAA